MFHKHILNQQRKQKCVVIISSETIEAVYREKNVKKKNQLWEEKSNKDRGGNIPKTNLTFFSTRRDNSTIMRAS